MANITLKNIPEDLYENLKLHAAANRRSLNNEIIVCIEKAIKSRKVDKEQLIRRLQSLRQTLKTPFLTNDMLNKIKNEGRL